MYTDPLHVLAIRASQWLQAVEQQFRRVVGPVVDPKVVGVEKYRIDWNQRQRDIDFFMMSLNRLRKAVSHANGQLPELKLTPALEAFDRAVPDLRALRDIGEHFEDYDWGKGRREHELTTMSPDYSWGPSDGGVGYRGKSLTLITSRDAARRLYSEARRALSEAGKTFDLEEWPFVKALF